MFWLNSGVRDRHNFSLRAILLFQKTGTDSVYHVNSGDIKNLVLNLCSGNQILKFWLFFLNCVGGAQMRGCLTPKFTQCVIALYIGLCDDIGMRCEIFWRIFWSIQKNCRGLSTYSNAHANAKNCIFGVQFPGNRSEFSILSNGF